MGPLAIGKFADLVAVFVPGPAGGVFVAIIFIGMLAVFAVWQLGGIADDLERTSPRARFKRGWSRVRALPSQKRRNRGSD